MGQFVNIRRLRRRRATDLIPGVILDGTQRRVRELHIDELFVVAELVLCGQAVEGVGREAGSHLTITTACLTADRRCFSSLPSFPSPFLTSSLSHFFQLFVLLS